MTREVYEIDGLPVRNLTKRINLTISEQDCRRGSRKAPGSCAAALALVRQIPDVSEARVHINRVFLKVGNRFWLRGKATGALRTEVVSFDRGGTFEPGEYVISPLSPSERPTGKTMGSHKKKRAGAKKRNTSSRAKPKVLHTVRRNALSEYNIRNA